MTTSHDPDDITAEFQIAGAWYSSYGGSDLFPGRIRGKDTIRITRGLADQQSSFSPTSGTFVLNNRDGLFSPKNALSPLFGKIKRNLPVRLGVQTGGTWDEYLRVPDINEFVNGQRAYTADKASLDITGDIDIRIEFTANYMRNRRQNLAGKYVITGNQRAWFLEIRSNGEPSLLTSPDGTLTNALTNLAGVTLAEDAGRMALRVTLDVNNGAAGRDYKWYTADTIAGPWTLISSATVAGTTSIFNSTAELEVGSASLAAGPFAETRQLSGRIHAFELYNGIGGTLVADFKPQGKGVGAGITWADTCASPNTWLLTGDNIRLGSDRIRLTAELTSLPEQWDVTGIDRSVNVAASSFSKRYQSNKRSIGSAIYRLYRNRARLTGYWPMEDESGATRAANVTYGTKPGIITSGTFGSTTGLDGSAGALTLSSAPNVSKAVLYAQLPTSSTGASTILFYFKLDTLPGTDQTFLTLNLAPGVMTKWVFVIGAATFRFIGYDSVATEIYNSGPIAFGAIATPLDQWLGMQISVEQDGADVRFQTSWHAVGTETFYTHFVGGTTTAGTLGKGIGRAVFDTPDAAFAGAQIAHVIISSGDDLNLVSTEFANASKGYSDETAGARMLRLAGEEDEPFEWLGDLRNTQACGPQAPDRFLNLMISAANVDGGLFGDGRDLATWRYVTRDFLGNRRGLTLDYSASEPGETPTPTTDDRYTVNDFTASRPSGSSARYEANDGRPLNVNDPDDPDAPGVGRYEQTGSFNAADDDQLYALASAQVAVGTWDESRVPNLRVQLHRPQIANTPALLAGVIAQDTGDPVTLTGLTGSPMAPEDVPMVTFGYTETISNFEWDNVANTVPAGPYQVPVLGTSDVNGEPRLDADFGGHVQVHGAYDSDDTAIILRTDQDFAAKFLIDTAGYAAEFPCDWMIGGEQMTMTACTAPSSAALLFDGTFEAAAGGVTGWDVSGATLAASSTFAHGGTQSALLTVTGSPTSAFIRRSSGYSTPVTAGKTYTVTAWVRSAVNLTDVHALISWYNSAGSQVGTSQGSLAALTSGSWASRTLSVAAPAGSVTARVGVLIGSSPANGTLLYVDDFTFTTTGYVYQTATMTRSVNSIVKAQVDGEEVHLFNVFNLGLE